MWDARPLSLLDVVLILYSDWDCIHYSCSEALTQLMDSTFTLFCACSFTLVSFACSSTCCKNFLDLHWSEHTSKYTDYILPFGIRSGRTPATLGRKSREVDLLLACKSMLSCGYSVVRKGRGGRESRERERRETWRFTNKVVTNISFFQQNTIILQ